MLSRATRPLLVGAPSRAGVRSYGRAPSLPRNLGLVVVPQTQVYIVERLGKYHRSLTGGWYVLIPFLDRIAYAHSLKETALAIPSQTAITRDNVTIGIDGVLYLRTNDPYAASYGINDPTWAVTQLAQTSMRSELGRYSLDKTFSERDSLNSAIVTAINTAARPWGIECLRYEIRDITPPAAIKGAMELQAEAERRKRAEILESEGKREAAINNAEGQRRSIVLGAQGEAEAILARAHASAAAVTMLASATSRRGGAQAVALRVAEQYVAAFGNIAKRGNTLLLPADTGNVGAMVAQALSVFSSIQGRQSAAASAAGAALPEEERAGGDAEEEGAEKERVFEDALRAVQEGSGARGPGTGYARPGGGGGGSTSADAPAAALIAEPFDTAGGNSISSAEAAGRMAMAAQAASGGGAGGGGEAGRGAAAGFTPGPYDVKQ